jgi:hypothetical protein
MPKRWASNGYKDCGRLSECIEPCKSFENQSGNKTPLHEQRLPGVVINQHSTKQAVNHQPIS